MHVRVGCSGCGTYRGCCMCSVLCAGRADRADVSAVRAPTAHGACRYDSETAQLKFVPDHEWKTKEMLSWREDDITGVLDSAQNILEDTAASQRVPVNVRPLLPPPLTVHSMHARIVQPSYA